MAGINFVYFDLGGVVIEDLTYSVKGWETMKKDLGVKPEQSKEFDTFYDQVEKEVQAGKPIDDYLPLFTHRFGLHFPPGYSMIGDFIARFHPNEKLWPLIREAKRKVRVGLLTNMYPYMLDAIKNAGLLPPVEWDAVVDSSREGVQKPDPRIYRIAQERARVSGEEILFIDDRKPNLEAARQAGWQTFFYDNHNRLETDSDLDLLVKSIHG